MTGTDSLEKKGPNLNTETTISSTQPSSPIHHAGEKPLTRLIQTWYSPLGHLLSILLITTLMVLKLDGYKALATENQSRKQPGGAYVLRVSDVTTIISSALVVAKLLLSIWTAVAVWRCAFALLEHGGLDAKGFANLMSIRLPPISFRKSRRGGSESGSMGWLVLIALLCLLPQPFIAPLLSGSVNWSIGYADGEMVDVQSNAIEASKRDWYYYLNQGPVRTAFIQVASGKAMTAWANTDWKLRDERWGQKCRHVVQENQLAVNSTLLDVIMPFIEIHGIEWKTEPVPDEVDGVVWTDKMSLVGDSPLYYTHNTGVGTLFDPDPEKMIWNTAKKVNYPADDVADFPEPAVFRGKQTVVIVLKRQSTNGCKQLVPNAFNKLDQIDPKSIFSKGNAYDEDCLIYGTVDFTAGVIKAPKARYISSRVVEAGLLSSSAKTETSTEIPEEYSPAIIEPSFWTTEALFLMRNIMPVIASANASSMPTWDNLDGYTELLIRMSYLAGWDTLHSLYEEGDKTILKAVPALPRLRATVSRARVFAWLGISVLVTISALVMSWVQAGCQRDIVLDGGVAALLTDAGEVVKMHPELSKISYATKEDEKLGKLHLVRVENDGSVRFRLELKNGGVMTDDV